MRVNVASKVVSALLFLQATVAPAQQDLRDALAGHHYAEALRLAQAKIDQNSKDPYPWFARALAQNGLGRATQSFASLDEALKLNPRYLPAAEAGAQIAYGAHDPRAARYLALILSQQPANATAHAMAGVLAFEKNDCASTIDHFEKAESMIATDANAEMQYAVCLGRVGDTAAATPRFEHLHTLKPDDRAATYNLASVYVDQKRFREAVQLLETSRTHDGPLDADSMNMLASAYAGNGQLAEAIDTYRAAIVLNPHDDREYSDLAILSMDHQSPAVALGVLEAGIRNNPKSAALYTMRGSIYAQIAKNEQAQSDFETADRLSPSQVAGTVGLGVLLRDDGNLDKAQGILETKLKTQPDNPVLNYMLADILIRNGAAPGQQEFLRAERLLNLSIARKPDFAQAHAALGKLQIKAGKLGPAIAQLELATRLDPTDRTALNQLVAAYRRSGRTEDAARVAAQLAHTVSEERAQETEKNRIHLILDTQGSTSAGQAPASP